MSATFELTIGATEADQVNKTETLQFTVAYVDDQDDIIDISSASITVLESYPESIAADMDIEITDGAAGIATCTLTAAQLASLGIGRVNWFRLRTEYASDSIDTTPKIWIEIT